LVLIAVCTAAAGYDEKNVALHVAISTATRSSPPRLIHRTVLLTYDSTEAVRHVGAVFSFEDYRNLHSYFRNEYGVFVLPLDIPEDAGVVRYRLVVDGLWTHDPGNPEYIVTAQGLKLSQLDFELPPLPLESPVVLPDGYVEFNFSGMPGARVYVSGDFNNWNPFMHRLSEVAPGKYTSRLPAYSGTHFYVFMVDGVRILDPLNPSNGQNLHGLLASKVLVP
jgi:hypothetical protein